MAPTQYKPAKRTRNALLVSHLGICGRAAGDSYLVNHNHAQGSGHYSQGGYMIRAELRSFPVDMVLQALILVLIPI